MLRRLFGQPQCPACGEEKALVDEQFELVLRLFGSDRIRGAVVVEPTPEFFPYIYDGTPEGAERLFETVCTYMGVDQTTVQLTFWEDAPDLLSVHVPGMFGAQQNKGAAGYYFEDEQMQNISINRDELRDPESAVATMAHELAHALLLGGELISHEEPHMEALTDLATICLGLGVFTCNNLLKRRAWTDWNAEGWSISRKGYISPEMAGWAMSLFAWHRGESAPRWAKYLNDEGRSNVRKGLGYLKARKAGD